VPIMHLHKLCASAARREKLLAMVQELAEDIETFKKEMLEEEQRRQRQQEEYKVGQA
jgi:hypothetical protein